MLDLYAVIQDLATLMNQTAVTDAGADATVALGKLAESGVVADGKIAQNQEAILYVTHASDVTINGHEVLAGEPVICLSDPAVVSFTAGTVTLELQNAGLRYGDLAIRVIGFALVDLSFDRVSVHVCSASLALISGPTPNQITCEDTSAAYRCLPPGIKITNH